MKYGMKDKHQKFQEKLEVRKKHVNEIIEAYRLSEINFIQAVQYLDTEMNLIKEDHNKLFGRKE